VPFYNNRLARSLRLQGWEAGLRKSPFFIGSRGCHNRPPWFLIGLLKRGCAFPPPIGSRSLLWGTCSWAQLVSWFHGVQELRSEVVVTRAGPRWKCTAFPGAAPRGLTRPSGAFATSLHAPLSTALPRSTGGSSTGVCSGIPPSLQCSQRERGQGPWHQRQCPRRWSKTWQASRQQ
jgi:hypothetical protein